MGLYDDINDGIKKAFDTDLADAVKAFQYRAIVIPDYDPAIGRPDKVITIYDSRGVFDGYTKTELEDESILPTDVKLIVLQSELLPPVQIDDQVQRLDTSKTFEIKGFGKDPADVSWVIQLRSMADAG